MVDFASIAAGLKAVEGALGIARTLRDTEAAVEKSELRLQLAELMVALADAKNALVDSKEQIEGLEARIAELMAIGEKNLAVHRGLYAELDDDGIIVDGPWCGRCRDVDGRLVRAVAVLGKGGDIGHCPQCDAQYTYRDVNTIRPGTAMPGKR